IDELRQEGEEEQRRLGIEQIDDEPVAEQPRMAVSGQLLAVFRYIDAPEDLLETQPDEIGGAGIFHDAEGEGGGGEQRREAKGCCEDMDQGRSVDAQIRDETGNPALLRRPR